MTEDIIIVDAEFNSEAERVATDAKAAEEILAKLCALLEEIKTNDLDKQGAGGTSNQTSAVFEEYIELVKSMQNVLQEIADAEKDLIQKMITEIDTVDGFLYG